MNMFSRFARSLPLAAAAMVPPSAGAARADNKCSWMSWHSKQEDNELGHFVTKAAGEIKMKLHQTEAPLPAKHKPSMEKLGNSLDHSANLDAAELARLAQAYALPVEKATITMAPDVPPPINRKHNVRLIVDFYCQEKTVQVSKFHKYKYWTFNGGVPGPFIRAKVGDVLELNLTNEDGTGVAHDLDFHAVTGPGGGGPALYAEPGETKTGIFKLLQPGLFFYHTAVQRGWINGSMCGLILVEPEEGLPAVDKEFYVMQHEIYATQSEQDKKFVETDVRSMLAENPLYVVFNGKQESLISKPLMVDQGDRVRIFFANGGPNYISSFHVIGATMDKVYREGDLISPPARGLQSSAVCAAAGAVFELDFPVPGSYPLLDHSMSRVEKGAMGNIVVKGAPRPDIYDAKKYQKS